MLNRLFDISTALLEYLPVISFISEAHLLQLQEFRCVILYFCFWSHERMLFIHDFHNTSSACALHTTSSSRDLHTTSSARALHLSVSCPDYFQLSVPAVENDKLWISFVIVDYRSHPSIT